MTELKIEVKIHLSEKIVSIVDREDNGNRQWFQMNIN